MVIAQQSLQRLCARQILAVNDFYVRNAISGYGKTFAREEV